MPPDDKPFPLELISMRCNAGGGKQVASTPAAAEQAVAGVSTPRDTLSIPQGHPFALPTPEGLHLWWPTTPELESLLPQMTSPPSPRVMGTGSALQAVEGMNTTQQLLQSAASTGEQIGRYGYITWYAHMWAPFA